MITNLRILPVILAGILLSAQAFAQDCKRDHSAYCDDSWRGFASFHTLLAPYHTEWKTEFGDDGNTVQIWSNAADISIEEIHRKIDNGARILLFDESETTVMLYGEAFSQAAIASDSPFIPEASHINGNPHLPVFHVNTQMKETFGLPDDSTNWRLAFNHPTPIVYQKAPGALGYVFSFAVKNDDTGGTIFVIRDESLMTRLMLQTYDNARFISALLDTLCMKTAPCRIDLYEPSIQSEPDITSLNSDNSQDAADGIVSKIRDFQSQIKEFNDTKLSNIPWKLLAMILLATWVFLGMASTFNWGRSKPE
ncbi:MAG: hypothetical protein IJU23_12970 [Proteobacteria bacterium]|nr:hypothetical protein [Pseudomonadota bacterium]